jgi:glycosyltransferase involved in cell wall biosynthesis
MRRQPDSLARALLDDLRRSDIDPKRFDVVDAHYFYPDGVAAARVAKALGLPLVISARGSDINLIGNIPFARERMLRAAECAQALIAVSEALARKMRALGMPASRIEVLRNGVDAETFSPVPRLEARRCLNLVEDTKWVAGIGNLVPEKGFDLLIRAIAQLPQANLLIVGQGPVRNDLRALAEAMAPGRVVFRDNMPQADLRFVYSACNVLGLPSQREGWPNVVLEAIACGTPVVASPVGGVPEILGPDAAARLVPERSVEAWASALGNMLSQSIEQEHVRRYAFRFGWDDVVARQCDLYDRVIEERAERAERSYA